MLVKVVFKRNNIDEKQNSFNFTAFIIHYMLMNSYNFIYSICYVN